MYLIFFADVILVSFLFILPEEGNMLFLKTLAFVLLFLFNILILIKHESCVPSFVVFCEDFTFKVFLFGSLLPDISREMLQEQNVLCQLWTNSHIQFR